MSFSSEAAAKLIQHISDYLHPLGNGALGTVIGSPEYANAMQKFDEAIVAKDEDRVKTTGNEVYRLVKNLTRKDEG